MNRPRMTPSSWTTGRSTARRPAPANLLWAASSVLAIVLATVAVGVRAATPARHGADEPRSGAATQGTDLARLLAAARADDLAMTRLEALCDDIGPRLGGSVALDRATTALAALLRGDGQEHVRREQVMVPHWVRGEEHLWMTAPQRRELAVLGLGGSVGTAGIEAPVAVVHSFDELSPAVAGRIVLYDVPMAASATGSGYGEAVQYRAAGASRAAAFGAVAALVRSVTTRSLYTPHTGVMHYDPEQPRIPTAAVTVEDAAWIDRLAARGIEVRLRLQMGAENLPDAVSHNVVGEILGSEHPEEIVVIGGHTDSWDIAPGAQDDGTGVIEAVEALRLIRSLGLHPRRTIRAVLFTNEENGLRGGTAYAEEHASERHVAAVESDMGAGAPVGWSAAGAAADVGWLVQCARPLGLPVMAGGGGSDVSPLGRQGVLLVGLRPDGTHYFDIHHSRADTVDRIDPANLREGVAAMAGLAWQLANEPRGGDAAGEEPEAATVHGRPGGDQ